MTIYAEQILEQAGKNQYFILFHIQGPTWDPATHESHMEWFTNTGVPVTLVAGMGETTPRGNLYHVAFDDDQDTRLHAYMNAFEDNTGTSLRPDMYQMLEWSYEGWVSRDGPQEFNAWLRQQTDPTQVTGP